VTIRGLRSTVQYVAYSLKMLMNWSAENVNEDTGTLDLDAGQ
jgi:hypothetical protein